MPLYEYECGACGQRFEVIQKVGESAPASCARCGNGPVVKLLSSPAIQFKGSGWYVTDYARKSTSEGAGSSTASKPAGDRGSDAGPSKPAESKPESKSQTAAPAKSPSDSTK